MAVYMMLTTIGEEGKMSAEGYSDRLKSINKAIEFLGVKVLSQYALLGPYDFVNIMDAPSDETIARLSINLRAMGVQTTTYAAIPLENLFKIMAEKKPPF